MVNGAARGAAMQTALTSKSATSASPT